MVNLKAKPFYLNDEEIEWVQTTIDSMSIEEKIGQLFVNLFFDFDENRVSEFIKKYPIGAARYMGGQSKDIQKLLNLLQRNSRIPLLVAANCDAGGNGACNDGTYIASGAQCEASQDVSVAYDAGYVSGVEESALGVNWNFDPCVDILSNWRNTIVNTRAYGSDADVVIKHTSEYIKGLTQSNVASCIKHFPGDGSEERDQHLVLGVNELSVKEWDESFGKVYQTLIDEGVNSIMVGHIAQPAYSKYLNPSLTDQDILPATLAYELTTTLLKEKLGFNGVVVTDASHMIGMAAAMKRKDYVPLAIAAGCDLFLFFNDAQEDYQFMMDGYKNGVITEARLSDALTRILGLKAKLKLHLAHAENKLQKDEAELRVIGCEKHLEMAKSAADKGITLVKDTQGNLPITPSTHKRIKLYTLYGELGGIMAASKKSEQIIVEELERAGFEVTVNDGNNRDKGKTAQIGKDFDAAFVFADIQGYATENNVRIKWKMPMSNEIPWYVHELPTVFVSLNFTTHLTDVPMVKTFINAYHNDRECIRSVIEKIMGQSEFKGLANENVFCNKWETRR